MADVTVQFVTGRGIESGIIRYFTRSEVSHVDLVITTKVCRKQNLDHLLADQPYDGDVVGLLGARLDGGVQIRRPNYAKFTRRYQCEFEIPDNMEDLFWKTALEQVGKPYDTKAILAFGFPWLHRRWSATNKWFCSEYVYYLFWRHGTLLQCVGNESGRIDPRDLLISPLRKNFRWLL